MHLTIIGTGFVGVVSSAVFASFGNDVVGLDIDPSRVESLMKGKVPFFEPGLEELLVKTQEEGHLTFTTSYEEAIPKSDVIMIAVGTPSAPDGQADLTYVFAACDSLASHIKEGVIIAIKSTVPPGTCDVVAKRLSQATSTKCSVVSLPEFLKEGTAVEDTLHPDRVVIGATDDDVIETLKTLHAPLHAPFVVMNPASAQMCKYAANAYLATRITFINQIANLCEQNGANIQEVVSGIGYDKRIGSHYWYPGFGYGGSCFPKDVKELAAYAKAIGQESNLMVTINELNEDRIPSLLRTFGKEIGGWSGKRVAVLGLSFKPNTDDMREAPSTKVIPMLLHEKADVRAYDPMANVAAAQWFSREGIAQSDQFRILESVEAAITDADIVFLLIEWKELISLDLADVASKAKPHAVLIDARNQYRRDAVEQAGMRYYGIGQ